MVDTDGKSEAKLSNTLSSRIVFSGHCRNCTKAPTGADTLR